MYSLLVVDDEPIITDAIYDLFIDNNQLDLDIYKAYSGFEAIERLKKTKIDIVLSDISMPGIDGLDLQKELLSFWPDSRMIFLTGFNEFEYIKAAIHNGSVDYILKTEGDDAVIQAVKKAADEIDIERKNEQLVEKAKMNISLAIPMLQTKYLLEIIEEVKYNPEEIRQHFLELEIPLIYDDPVLILVGQVDFWPKDMTATNKMKTLYSINSVIGEYLSKSATAISITYDNSKIIWLIQPKLKTGFSGYENKVNEIWDRLNLVVQGSMDSIQKTCKEMFQIPISLVVSSEPSSFDRLPDRFDSLILTLSKASGMTNEMLLIDNNIEYNTRLQLKKFSLLKDYLENGEEDMFFPLYMNIMEKTSNSTLSLYNVSIEVFYSIATLFLSHINRWKLVGKFDPIVDLNKLANMESYSCWEEIVVYFKTLAESIFNFKKDYTFKNANRIFSFIKNYTEQHLDGDLTLTKFASLLHFHPFYLSRLFKQVTGESLTEYVSGVRLDKAKELLCNSSIKVSKIAVSLGFETQSYFTKFFKKYTNVPPQEYRLKNR